MSDSDSIYTVELLCAILISVALIFGYALYMFHRLLCEGEENAIQEKKRMTIRITDLLDRGLVEVESVYQLLLPDDYEVFFWIYLMVTLIAFDYAINIAHRFMMTVTIFLPTVSKLTELHIKLASSRPISKLPVFPDE
jgi:hypothetical protein